MNGRIVALGVGVVLLGAAFGFGYAAWRTQTDWMVLAALGSLLAGMVTAGSSVVGVPRRRELGTKMWQNDPPRGYGPPPGL